MRLLFVFVLISLALTNSKEDKKKKKQKKDEKKQSTTPSPTELEVYELCLDVNKISLNDMKWDEGSASYWAGTEGIVYVYNPEDSIDTFQTMKFPIIAANKNKKSDNDKDKTRRLQQDETTSSSTSTSTSTSTPTTPTTLPTEFKFNDDEKKVGCWIEPDFHEINLRFKLYQFYHTALKAVTIVEIPPIDKGEEEKTVTLNTLPYQYSEATVEIEYKLKWKKKKLPTSTPAPVPGVKTPGIEPALFPPGPPPIDANAIIDVENVFDSDEATDNIIDAEKELSDDNSVVNDIADVENEEKVEVEQDVDNEENEVIENKEDKLEIKEDIEDDADNDNADNDDDQKDFVLPNNPQNSSTDWMFIAAFISSIMGLFVLVYICIWAYKHYGRDDYEKIGATMNNNNPSKLNRALGKVKRISLRNIGKNNGDYDEESRNIMHPSASYTFDDD